MNKNFGSKSLAVKLLAVSACAITALLTITFIVVICNVRERAVRMTLEQAHTDAKATSESFVAKVAMLTGATDFLAGALAKNFAAGKMDRAELTAMLPAAVEKSSLVFGSWFMEAPLGFDGQLGPISSEAMGTNSAGQFAPYWTRADSGLALIRPNTLDYTAEYYDHSAKSGKPAATEPYVEANAGDMLMMSITAPVIVNNKLRGVLGIDIGLGTLADALRNERPFGTGRVYLLAASGKWLAAPTDDLIMKAYEAEGTEEIKAAMTKGEVVTIENVVGGDGSPSYRVIYPFELPGLNARWYIVEDVPQAAVSAIVNEQTKMLVVGGVVTLLAVVAALLFAVRAFIQKPMAALLDEVDNLSEGSYERPVSGQNRADEIGALATSLEDFRHKLANGRALEQAATRQREIADAERTQAEKQRAWSAETERRVVDALGRGLSKLSGGNLSYRILEDFPEGYCELRNHYNAAAESLQKTIIRLNETVHTLNVGTGEISHSTDQLAKRTEQQAASLEEAAAALSEISQKLSDSASNAGLAARKIEQASSDADGSSVIVCQAISAMERIDASSRQVSQIIGVIDEISFQTNLLALNAGVEAARAGEAGKGFAVVAQEVRELAQRAASAAKQIKSLISASGDQVKQGVSLVGQTGEALARITDQVRAVNDLIQHISHSAREQASGLREINATVNQMDQMTQQNAAMVEETTAASSMLNVEANSLRDLILGFELGEVTHARPRDCAA